MELLSTSDLEGVLNQADAFHATQAFFDGARSSDDLSLSVARLWRCRPPTPPLTGFQVGVATLAAVGNSGTRRLAGVGSIRSQMSIGLMCALHQTQGGWNSFRDASTPLKPRLVASVTITLMTPAQ